MIILKDLRDNVYILNNCVGIHRKCWKEFYTNHYWIRLYTSKEDFLEIYSSVDKHEIECVYNNIIDALIKADPTKTEVLYLKSLINKYKLLVEIFGKVEETEDGRSMGT